MNTGQRPPEWLVRAVGGDAAGLNRLASAMLGREGVLGRGGFSLRSAAFEHGGELDPCFTADEEDAVAPPFEWTAPPAGAQELVLIAEDADSPGEQAHCHWLVWGLAGQKGQLLEGEVPPRVGKNALRNSEWQLPDLPAESEPHRYVFQLFATELPLTLMPGATREDVMRELDGNVSALAILTATYAGSEDDEMGWDADSPEN